MAKKLTTAEMLARAKEKAREEDKNRRKVGPDAAGNSYTTSGVTASKKAESTNGTRTKTSQTKEKSTEEMLQTARINASRKDGTAVRASVGPDPTGNPEYQSGTDKWEEMRKNRLARDQELQNRQKALSARGSSYMQTTEYKEQMADLNRQRETVQKQLQDIENAARGRRLQDRITATGTLERARGNADFEQSVKAGRKMAADVTASGATFEQSKVLEHAQNALANKRKGGREYGFAEGNMTEDELNTLLYYIGRGDWQNAGRYWDALEPELNARYAGVRQEWIAEEAEENPLLGLARYAVGAMDGRGAVATGIAALTGGEADPNSAAFSSTIDRGSIRQKFTEQGRAGLGGIGGAIGGDTGRAVGEWLGDQLVGAGLSVVDMGVDALVGGGLASYTRGLTMIPRVASDTSRDVLQRGGTAQQAITAGALSSVVEYLSEQIPLEQISKAINAYPMTAKQKVADILLAAGFEGTEEVVSEIAGNVVDALVMQDSSEFNLKVQELTSQGLSKDEAYRKAMVEFYLVNPANAFVGGALAGGGMALGGRVANAAITGGPVFQADPNAMTLSERVAVNRELRKAAADQQAGTQLVEKAIQEIRDSGEVSEATAKEITENGIAVAQLFAGDQEALTGMQTPAERETAVREAMMAIYDGRAQEDSERQTFTGSQVERLAEAGKSTLGEAGQRALMETYTDSSWAEVHYGAFARAYTEGLTGKHMSVNRTTLSDEQYEMAYKAGLKDAAASLAAENERAKSATVYKGGDALIENEVSAKLDAKTKNVLRRIAHKTGVKVALFDYAGDGVHGYIEDGVIHIAANSNQGVLQIAAHEITHQMQELAPEQYRKFRDYAVQARARNTVGGVGALVADYQLRYSKKATLTADQAMDEAAADYTRDLIEHSEAFDELVQKDRTVAQRFVESVKAFLKKVASVFTGKEDRDRAVMGQFGTSYETLRKAADLWDKTLKATERQVERAQERTEEKSERGGKKRLSYEDGNDTMLPEEGGKDGRKRSGSEEVAKNLRNAQGIESGTDGRDVRTYGTGGNGIVLRYDQLNRIERDRVGDIISSALDGNAGWRSYLRAGGVKAEKAFYNGIVDGSPLISQVEAEIPGFTDAVKAVREIASGIKPAVNSVTPSLDVDATVTDHDSNGKLLTKAQQKFFRHSKVRDENGNLLIVYHGTRSEHFDTYEYSPAKQTGDDYGEAYYFTTNLQNAKGYAKDNEKDQRLIEYNKGKDALIKQFVAEKDPSKQEAIAKEIKSYTYNGMTRDDIINDLEYDTGGEVKRQYLNIVNPLIVDARGAYHYQVYPDYFRQARASRKDGIIVKNVYDSAVSGVGLSDVYIAFYQNQIKNTDNENPTNYPDTRYSYETAEATEAARLERENAQLRERVEYWKGQTKRTRGSVVDLRTAKAAAKRLVKDFDADVDVDRLTEKIQKLYKAMGGKGGQVDYEALRRMANGIASEIAETATVTDGETYTMYQDLRKDLKQMTLTIGNRDLENIPDFTEWRKKYRHKLKIGIGPTNIDKQFADLAQQYPELFEEYLDAHPADQLLRIAEVADAISTVSQSNPYESRMAEAVNEIGNEVLLRVMDLPPADPTFADKQAKAVQDARLAGQMAQGREDAAAHRRERERLERRLAATGRRLDEVRRARDEQLREIVERNKEGRAKRKESNATKELRAKILRHTKQLSQKLLRPTDNQHVPEGLRKTVATALASINLSSIRSYDENGKLVKGQDGAATKRTTAFAALRDEYKAILKQDDIGMVVDPDLLGMDDVKGLFDQVIDMEDTPVDAMNSEQLGVVWKVIKSLEHSITTAGKTLADTRWADIHTGAREFYEQNYGQKSKHYLGEKRETLNLQDPVTFFHNFGDAGMELFHLLRKAQDSQRLMREDVKRRFEQIVRGKDAYKWEEKAHEFTTERGAKLVLTEAQIMDLYLLSQRKQAEGHLMVGGVTQPEVKSKGVKRDGGLIKLTAGDLDTIFSKLSEEQITVAKGLQELTSTVLSKYGNDASMKVYGYLKFLGKDYWPIRVAGEDLKTQPGASADVIKTVKNLGMTKAVVPEAKNGVELGSVFDVFAAHASDMEMYSSWLAATEDAMRLFNYRFREDDGYDNGGRDVSVKELMDKVAGVGAQQYFKTLMDDLQNGLRANGDDYSKAINKAIGKTRAASIGGNIRVIVQQPTAALRALAEMNPVDLAAGTVKGVTKGNGWKKALKYSPIAMQKAAGGVDISTGWSLKSELLGPEKALDKVNEAMMKGAAAADAVTWGKLWNAAEHQVHRQQPDLRPGSDEFYAAVNEVFSDVVDKTQVVDGVLQRSQLMRSPSDLSKMATAFMGEPTKTLNMMIRAYDDFRLNSGKERSAAAKRALRVGAALLVTDVVNAFMQSLVDGLRDDDEDKKYLERVLEAFMGVTEDDQAFTEKLWAALIEGNLGQQINPVGRVPYAKDVLSILQGFTVERSDMAVVTDVIGAGKSVLKSIQGESKQTVIESTKNLVGIMSKFFGLSVSNVLRDVTGIIQSVATERDNLALLYALERLRTDLKSGKANSVYYDHLFLAKEAGDQELYEKIYRDMVDAGITDEKIRSGMESRMKNAKGVDEASELDKRWMNPEDEAEYDGLLTKIQGSPEWSAADEDDQSWLKDKLFDLAIGNESGEKLRTKMKQVEETTGFSEDEYLLLMLEEQMAKEEKEESESDGGASIGDLADVLFEMYQNGDSRYESTYNALIARGYDEKTLRSAMDERLKKAQGVDRVDELEQRYLSPSEQREYNAIASSAKGTGLWYAASAEQRENFETNAYDIVTGTETGLEMQAKIDAGAHYGIDESDYLLYKLALEIVDQPTKNGNYGSYTQAEVEAAINELDGLSQEAKAYLWQSQNKSWKSYNNPFR